MIDRLNTTRIAPALLLCLGLAACGDDGSAVSATDTTSTGTTDDTSATGTTSPDVETTVKPTTGPTTSTTDDSTTGPTGTDGTTTDDDTTTTTTDGTDTTTDTTTTGPDETCRDGVQNQDETDIDCGGATCAPCAIGQTCGAHTDCIEGACIDGVCATTECLVDSDCDALDGECVEGVCDQDSFTCTTAAINEGGACDDGDLCSAASVCTAGACVASEAVDCSALDSACVLGVCDPNDGQCVAQNVDDGTACDDGNGCTANTVCAAGVCGDPNDPGYVFYEDFADNDAGWTLDDNWEIGSAVAGCGDPGTDHTDTDDNGIAGVVLGDCAPTSPVNADLFYCLTSPAIDTTSLASVNLGFWRDLYSDYAPYMKNKIEVFDGNAWHIIFETFGSPGVDDSGWTRFDYDITAHSNPALQVRWCYNIGSSGAFSRGSWNIDDVVISAAACDP
jgi:hypothetical protein